MLKRKVSAIWVLILAVITVFACAFAAVTYIRCVRHMSTPKAKEIGKFCFLNAESDAEGVSFEIINAREVGLNCVLDLRWVNRSGKTIQHCFCIRMRVGMSVSMRMFMLMGMSLLMMIMALLLVLVGMNVLIHCAIWSNMSM